MENKYTDIECLAKENKYIDIEYLVNTIENIMCSHSPMEAIYNDILEDMETEIPLQPCTEQWKAVLQTCQMGYDDFICNVLMAVLSDICSAVSIKGEIKYLYTSDKAVRQRQKKVIETKEKVYGKDLYKDQPYFLNPKRTNMSGFYLTELLLVMHEEITEDGGKKNPLLKLVNSDNINLEHFSGEDLDGIVKYYKSICEYMVRKKIPLFQRMMILYHLEMETRFSTIFQILKMISDENLNDIQKETLYRTREICSINFFNRDARGLCHYQNLIYFGKQCYCDDLAKCCLENRFTPPCRPEDVLKPMYEIVKFIYVIRDTIINRLNKIYGQDYQHIADNTLTSLQSTFSMNEDKLSYYEKRLLQGCQNIMDEYNSFNGYDIKVDHFVRMYVSDDKFESFQSSEDDKKKKKAEQRKAKNKKEQQS